MDQELILGPLLSELSRCDEPLSSVCSAPNGSLHRETSSDSLNIYTVFNATTRLCRENESPRGFSDADLTHGNKHRHSVSVSLH